MKKRTFTDSEIDDIYEKIDRAGYQSDYIPTMNELDIHHVDSLIHTEPGMAEYLLYIQDSLPQDMTDEQKKVNSYISSLFI